MISLPILIPFASIVDQGDTCLGYYRANLLAEFRERGKDSRNHQESPGAGPRVGPRLAREWNFPAYCGESQVPPLGQATLVLGKEGRPGRHGGRHKGRG